jgi:signal transduction histidine kinase
VLALLSRALRAEVGLEQLVLGDSPDSAASRGAIPQPRIRSTVDVSIGARTDPASGALSTRTSARPIDLPVTSRGVVLAVLSIEPSPAGLPGAWAASPASLGMIADLLALALTSASDAGEQQPGNDTQAVAETWFEYEERDRAELAGHLHDGLVQSLIAARYLLDVAAAAQPDGPQPWLATLRESLLEALADGRGLLHSLQPRTKHGRGLRVALEDYSATSRFPVRLCAADPRIESTPQLSPVVAAAAYRFAQAAVSDLRTRGADSAEVELGFGADGLSLDVHPGAKGEVDQESGLSLKRWANRIELLGGDVQLQPGSAHLRFTVADEELAPSQPLASRS